MPLSPRQLYETAVRDMRTLRENAVVRNDKKMAKQVGASSRHQGRTLKTGFLYKHVAYAPSPLEVLRRAADDMRKGQASKDRLQAALYESPRALWEAIEYGKEVEGVIEQTQEEIQKAAQTWRDGE